VGRFTTTNNFKDFITPFTIIKNPKSITKVPIFVFAPRTAHMFLPANLDGLEIGLTECNRQTNVCIAGIYASHTVDYVVSV
jgi:hypothetical protein